MGEASRQVLPVLVRILGAAPPSSSGSQMNAFNSQPPVHYPTSTTPPPTRRYNFVPATDDPGVSLALCVFEQKVDRKRVLENSRVDYLRAACVFYDGNLSGRQTLQLHLMLVSKPLLKIIHILLSLLDPKLRSSPQLFRSNNISWQFNW